MNMSIPKSTRRVTFSLAAADFDKLDAEPALAELHYEDKKQTKLLARSTLFFGTSWDEYVGLDAKLSAPLRSAFREAAEAMDRYDAASWWNKSRVARALGIEIAKPSWDLYYAKAMKTVKAEGLADTSITVERYDNPRWVAFNKFIQGN